ncbi:MAG: ABC transporter permease [Acholeplasmatales bacterium]|nr:MAG: ABC transporter permease [Acholeplasmatales bacterium]
MKIILKYIGTSMWEKKLRLLLFVVSIAFSTALLMVSMGIVRIQLDTIRRSVTDVLEEHEIMIASNTGADFFALDTLEQVGIDRVIPSIVLPSVLRNQDFESVMLYARDIDVISQYRFVEGSLETFMGAHTIISQRVAVYLGLALGDILEVTIAGAPIGLTVVGIVENAGLFYQDQRQQFNMLVPYGYVSEALGVEGLYNHVTARQTLDDTAASMALFNAHHEDFRAFAIYQEDIVIASVRNQQMTFFIMLAFIMLVATVILFGAFKLIMTERQKVIGTFFSQGATKRQMKLLLLSEGLMYGLLGGLVGILLGLGALYALHYSAAPLRAYGVIPRFVFEWELGFIALGFAMLFSVFACYVPVRSINRYEVKELILEQSPTLPNVKKKKFVVGMIFLISCFGMVYFGGDLAVTLSPLTLVLALCGLILVYPFIVSRLVKTLFPVFFPYVRFTALSMNNIRYSSSLRNNIAIMMIALISVITVVSLGKGIERIVIEAYTTLHFDIRVDQIKINDRDTRATIFAYLETHPLVQADSISEITYAHGHINGEYAQLEGIEPVKFAELLTYIDFSYKAGSYLEYLHPERHHIIASKTAANRLHLAIGDFVDLEINSVVSTFKVVGIVDAKLWNGGDTFFIHNDHMKEIFHNHNSIYFFHTTIAPSEAVDEIRSYFRDVGGITQTHQEMERMNTEQNQQLISMLNFFSLFAVIMASFGAINNMFISFLQRKKDFAVMASVGATRGQIGRMLVMESVLCVGFALVALLLYVSLHMRIVSQLAHSIGFSVDIQFVFLDSALLLMLSGVIYVLATIPLLMQSKKISIIQALKYE